MCNSRPVYHRPSFSGKVRRVHPCSDISGKTRGLGVALAMKHICGWLIGEEYEGFGLFAEEPQGAVR